MNPKRRGDRNYKKDLGSIVLFIFMMRIMNRKEPYNLLQLLVVLWVNFIFAGALHLNQHIIEY